MNKNRTFSLIASGVATLLFLTSCAGPSDYERARIADCERLAFSESISGPPLTATEVSNLESRFTKVSETLATILITFTYNDFEGNPIKFRHQCSVDGFDVITEFNDTTPE